MATAPPSSCTDDELCEAALLVASVRACRMPSTCMCWPSSSVARCATAKYGLSTASWVADHVHVARGGVATRVKVANKLRAHLGEVDAALSDGRISFDHARALADAANPRIVERVAQHQTELLQPAEHLPFAVWRRLVTELTTLWDEEAATTPLATSLATTCTSTRRATPWSSPASWSARPRSIVTQTIEAETDELWRRYQRDHELCPELELPTRAALRALALASICRRAARGRARPWSRGRRHPHRRRDERHDERRTR